MAIDANALRKTISTAFGGQKPDLILTDCRVLNVITGEIEQKDIVISGKFIAAVRADAAKEYAGQDVPVVSLNGGTVCPGLIDSHIHIESSMLSPIEFARAVIPHGTCAVVTDPHEIANVAGTEGIDFMIEQSRDLPMHIYFVMPSCVPATPLDENGATIDAESILPYLSRRNILGLAELMNAYGTVHCDEEIIQKIIAARSVHKIVDGHAPGLTGIELQAYIASGVDSDHECSTFEEAVEKLRLGQWIMIRQGTAAHNLKNLLPLFDDRYSSRCLLATDDSHPGDLHNGGHIDRIIRDAISLGANPITAVKMATINAASYFRISGCGAVVPGYRANLIVVDSLDTFNVLKVFNGGKLIAENGVLCPSAIPAAQDYSQDPRFSKVFHSFNVRELKPSDFEIQPTGTKRRIIQLIPGELLTGERIAESDPSRDESLGICRLAVIERHRNTGHIGLGYVSGYGLKRGAVASSIAHDSHNLVVAGTNSEDMALAANTVRENGGLAVVLDGAVLGYLPLPIAGLMCDRPVEQVDAEMDRMKAITYDLGVEKGIDPFMTLAFTSLPVIPSLRMTTHGLVQVETQSIIPVFF